MTHSDFEDFKHEPHFNDCMQCRSVMRWKMNMESVVPDCANVLAEMTE